MPPSPPLAPFPWWDVIIILLLVILNGLLAMSELAIVSSRRPRLKAMARAGRHGAQTALDLPADPGRFLSTVQSGITLIAVLSGAFSGRRARRAGRRSASPCSACPARRAETLGFTLVIILTTYASLVIGELVPKQIALRSPEPIAVVVALPMRWMSRGHDALRLAARPFQRPRLPPAPDEPRIRGPGHRRGSPAGRRRSGDRGRARGKRAGS